MQPYEQNLRMHRILEVTMGSTAHGTNVQDGLEDLDIMAVGIEPKDDFVGFNPVDTVVWRSKPAGMRSEAGDIDFVCYGLRKYLSLALKGNPSILLALFVHPDHVRQDSVDGLALRALAPRIVSRNAYACFRGYMQQQKERLVGLRARNVTRPELVARYGYDTKYAAHIVRLGRQGCELMKTGRITLPMKEEDRQLCLDIRTGKYSLAWVLKLVDFIEDELERDLRSSPLPGKPDYELVQKWMTETYLNYWNP